MTTEIPDRDRNPSLRPGFNEFVCRHCGHHVGDPRRVNWSGACPACGKLTRFVRVELIRGEVERSRDLL
jgi:predicted ATP-dependent serine protease